MTDGFENEPFLLIYFENYDLNCTYCSSDFNEKRIEISKNTINWVSFQRAGKITPNELDLIEKLDNLMTLNSLGDFLHDNSKPIAVCLVKLTEECAKGGRVTEYFIELLLRIFEKDVEYIKIFDLSMFNSLSESLIRLISSHMDFCAVVALIILTKIVCFSQHRSFGIHIDAILMFSKVHINTNSSYLSIILRNLKFLFRINSMHRHLINHSIVADLPFLIRNSDIQISYQSLFCLWCMTFTRKDISYLIKFQGKIIVALTDLVSHFKKEKILRMCIYILNNLTQFGDNARQNKVFFHIMAHNDLHVHLDAILKSPPDLKDETLLPMIESLHEKVNSVVDDLTSFEQYQIELSSGKLVNNMLHSNENFWKENISRFIDNDEEIKKLIQFLNVKFDPKSIDLALEDVNLYLKHHPLGKKNLNEMNVKAHLYELLKHRDSVVQMKALSTIQKLLIL